MFSYSEARFDKIVQMEEERRDHSVKKVLCPICKHVHNNVIAGCGVMVGKLECLCVGGPKRAHLSH